MHVSDRVWRADRVESRLNALVTGLQRTHPRDWGPLVALAAVDLVPGADLALVLATEGPLAPRVVAAAGERAETWTGSQLELTGEVLDQLRAEECGVVVPSLRLSSAGTSVLVSALVAPLACRAHGGGALLVGRLPEGGTFTEADMAALGGLIRQVELSVGWQRRCEHQLRAEQLRIAAQVQEHVVGPLFAMTLELANVAAAAPNAVLRSRLVDAVSGVDDVMAWLRARLRAVTGEPAA